MNAATPPKNSEIIELVIERLGHRGEGVARVGEALVFAPYALAGETVRAAREGDRACVVEIVAPSPDRIAPICPHYGVCGGCAVQTLKAPAYAAWKRELVSHALHNAGVDLPVAALIDAHGAGRRRATFHARMEQGKARVGFMQARAHEIVEIDSCPLLAPELANALPASRAIAQALAGRGKPLDIIVSASGGGLDIDLRGAGALDEPAHKALMTLADRFDLARLSNHGRLVTLRRTPDIAIGAARITPPAGAFLQATEVGEETLARLVDARTQGAKRIGDLFCGVGAFALRLAQRSMIYAFDNHAEAIAALLAGARALPALRLREAQTRDLFRRPLLADELNDYDAIIFDPPRAGAQAQAEQIAASVAPLVVAVSCNAQTFARDAQILISGGYLCRDITPVDQFRFSPHVEIVATFERERALKRRRSLLSR